MFILNGCKIDIGLPCTVGDTVYPNLLNPVDREAAGVVEVSDPVRPQPEEDYIITENLDGSLNVERRSDEVLQKRDAHKASAAALQYLRETDWYVVRFSETGTAIPAEVLSERAAARGRVLPPEVVLGG